MTGIQETKTNKALWWIALGAAMWGLDAVFITSLLHHLSAIQIVCIEHVLLMLFAVPVLIRKRGELRHLYLADWLAILFIAFGGSALASILFTAGFLYGNANVVLLLQKLQPLFAVLLAAWILKEQFQKQYWLILCIALAGAYLLTFGFHIPVLGHDERASIGALCAIGAAGLWGGSTVMGKRLVGKLSFTTLTALRFFVALPLLLILVLIQHPSLPAIGHALILAPVWGNLLFQTLVPSLFSLLIYYHGLGRVRASHATIAELAFPATGLCVNWIFLHQHFTVGQFIGFIIIWASVIRLTWMPKDVYRKRVQLNM